MRTNWKWLLSLVVITTTVLSGGKAEASTTNSNVSVYSGASPLFVYGGAYGSRGPGDVSSYFNWENLSGGGVGKGATVGGGGGGGGSDNPDIYFRFGFRGNFERLGENPIPDYYISQGWDPSGNYGSRTGFEVTEDEALVTYDSEGNLIEFIFNNEFRLSGSADMYMYAHLDKEDLTWDIATSMYAQASVAHLDGARILSFKPHVSSFDFNGYESTQVNFEGLGVVPGDAYTITAINGVAVPEPATMVMLAMGGASIFWRRKKLWN